MKKERILQNLDFSSCEGCYCYNILNNHTHNLQQICVGIPSVRVNTLPLIFCPCTNCMIKVICKTPCKEYETYKLLAHDFITYRLYKQKLIIQTKKVILSEK